MAKQKNARISLSKILPMKINSKDPGSLLSKLFRTVMTDTGMVNKADSLLDAYVKNSKNEDTGKERDKSAAFIAVSSESMTWKTFMDLMANMVLAKEMTFSIKINHGKSRLTGEEKITVHNLVVLSTNPKEGEKNE